MPRAAGFHPDNGWRQLGKKRQKPVAPQLPAQHHLLGGIDPVQLKNMLRRIHSNADNLVHGRLPCLRFATPHSGTTDAVGGRPHHHAVTYRAGEEAETLFTIKAGGYGSPLSRGRRGKLTLPSSALSTCARGGPACPSSDGEGRRCCLLRARAPVLSRARRRRQ